VVAGGLLEETRNPPEWLLQALRDLHARNIPIITLCSGAFVAGNAGLLDGRHCAIHFTTRDEFRVRFPKAIPVIDKTYIKDGGIISCRAAPLSIWRRILSASTVGWCARRRC
jgi:transcriptional regulator GlxA family with amidase domain